MPDPAEARDEKPGGMDVAGMRLALASSSTNRRIGQLRTIEERIRHDEFDPALVPTLLRLLFATCAFYPDRQSRRAVQQCLASALSYPRLDNDDGAGTGASFEPFITAVTQECVKPSIAVSSAFVLVEWCSLLTQRLAGDQALWDRFGTATVMGHAHALERCLQPEAKASLAHSAIIVTRRGLRRLVAEARDRLEQTLGTVVRPLCAAGSQSTAAHAIYLGVVAGVSGRLAAAKAVVAALKAEYFGFYIREVIGSRTSVPSHIASGLRDFFAEFTTADEFEAEMVPALEKGLLRAPEIVLRDVMGPLISALPDNGYDLSRALSGRLLKPILTNVKSSSPEIRAGAVTALRAVLSKSHDLARLADVADEILAPLRTSKLTTAEQKIAHAQMLESMPLSGAIAEKMVTALAAVASKEGNEGALAAETAALAKAATTALRSGVEFGGPTIEPITKGLADKKHGARRLWLLRVAEVLYSYRDAELATSGMIKFAEAVLPRLADAYNDVVASPSVAAQNGLVVGGLIGCALADGSLVQKTGSAAIRTAIEKMAVDRQCLVAEPKPSFLLSTRIYTKLTGGGGGGADEESRWLIRALFALSSRLSEATPAVARVAWAEAVIYVNCAPDMAAESRKEAGRCLSAAYARNPGLISSVIIEALWKLLGIGAGPSSEAAAWLAKGGLDQLASVLRAICLTPKEAAGFGRQADPEQLARQLCSLLVLARPRLIPRANWIELCLRTESDPGALARERGSDLLREIVRVTNQQPAVAIRTAAYEAAAELAFVAPEPLTGMVVDLVRRDLGAEELRDVTPLDVAIMKAAGDVPVVDVLSGKPQQQTILDKNTKDSGTLKREQDMRATVIEVKQGTGRPKWVSAEDTAKIGAQLRKEAVIRQSMRALQARIQRGVGIVRALATGPPTDPVRWLGAAVTALLGAIDGGAALITAPAAAPKAYIACADSISSRLGPMRPVIGAATLRARGVGGLSREYRDEALDKLATRVLYRLRFASEQLPLDVVSFVYALPLVLHVLRVGGVGEDGEERETQIVLAIETLSFHSDICAEESVPREEILTVLITAMRQHTEHYKIARDCFADVCRCTAPSMGAAEMAALAAGAIVPEVAVRTAVLQNISAEVDMTELGRSSADEIWLAAHDDDEENRQLACDIWDESGFQLTDEVAVRMLPRLGSKDEQLRRAAARALAEAVAAFPDSRAGGADAILNRLTTTYTELAQPRVPRLDEFGIPKKTDLSDPWEGREGVGLALGEMASGQVPLSRDQLDVVFRFLGEPNMGPLRDPNARVRGEILKAGLRAIEFHGRDATIVDELMATLEKTLEVEVAIDKSAAADLIREGVVIMYGALAGHLPTGDGRIPAVIERLLATLSTPSETVQYAIAECLPPLIRACGDRSGRYLGQVTDSLLTAKSYAARRGAAYGLAGLVVGRGVGVLREYRTVSAIRNAADDKKDTAAREAAFLAIELLSTVAGRLFEPYVIELVPVLLVGFSDGNGDVRDACLAAAKAGFGRLSSYGVKRILPTLLEGLGDPAWRSKRGACDLLGAMAYLDPHQLAASLPEIIPPLTAVLSDSHRDVRTAANKSLRRFGEVIRNPEIRSLVDVLLRALSDPIRHTDEALDSLIRVRFVHYLDAPSLALVIRILQRGLGGDHHQSTSSSSSSTSYTSSSGTRRKAAQVIGSLAHLTERRDLAAHLPGLVAGLRVAAVDAVPTTRATASRALGSLVGKLGEDALPDLIPSLMQTLRTETGAGDLLGSAQALSEVLAGLGTARLEETLPTILHDVESTRATVREGFMSLFIFLPVCFGNSFAAYLGRVIPPILAGLADEADQVREIALRAGRLLVRNFSSRAVDLLLPELERGLADDSHRIRLSSVELVGELLFNLTGIGRSAAGEEDAEPEPGEAEREAEREEMERKSRDAGAAAVLRETLGSDRRDKVLAALYICRCDTATPVRVAAAAVWKALVHSPRVLREITPTLTQLIIRRLGSSGGMERRVIAGNALGELVRRAGDGVLTSLLPTLESGLHDSPDSDAKQGICLALRELVVASGSAEALEEHEPVLMSIVRTALAEPDPDVREAAAEAFDALQRILGRRAIDQVLPHLLARLRSRPRAADDDDGSGGDAAADAGAGSNTANSALQALLTLLTDPTRSAVILPNLIPTLTAAPISAFNARALAALAGVAAGPAMNRRLPGIINGLLDGVVTAGPEDESLRRDLEDALDAVLRSAANDQDDEGLNAVMNVMLSLLRHDDHHRRAATARRLIPLFAVADVAADCARVYGPDVVRGLLILFDDRDPNVVAAAHAALSEFTRRIRKEQMEALVVSSRQSVLMVGIAGADLRGFALPRGPGAILPIFLQGLMGGGPPEQRAAAAAGIADVVDRAPEASLRPFVTQMAGPLIRVVSERSTEVRCESVRTLNRLLDKMPAALKPFLPQLQRTFAKSLADPASELLRARAARALGSLIRHAPRVDPLVAELVAGARAAADSGVRIAMLRALYEVIGRAGSSMGDTARAAVLGLLLPPQSQKTDATADAAAAAAAFGPDSVAVAMADDHDDGLTVVSGRLLAALVRVVPDDAAAALLRSRVVVAGGGEQLTSGSVMALNAVLAESAEVLLQCNRGALASELPELLAGGMKHRTPFVAENSILACGKFLLGAGTKTYDGIKVLFETVAALIPPGGGSADMRRLALVLVRTVGRISPDLARPHLGLLAPPVFASVRDPVIPVKLAAEAAFVSLFRVADEEARVFDRFMAAHTDELGPATSRAMGDYFRRVGLRLGQQVRERREAEGGDAAGGTGGALGLASDERDDEREIWSVGREAIGGGGGGGGDAE